MKKPSDIKVLGAGWWCPTMCLTFPHQCSHSQHRPELSVRCVIVTEDRAISAVKITKSKAKQPETAAPQEKQNEH